MLAPEQAITAVDEPRARRRITSLGVVTRHRPQAALRCLRGFQPLPPFFPVLRGEDLAFSALVRG
jgi:hypothetical protein